MYNTDGTIKDALSRIERHEYVLPAIQREFVWEPDQIECLFDSLMQGYPFGTFLFWQVEPETSQKFKFFEFVRDYHERDHAHCPDLTLSQPRGLIAVLDGQQRLTALNIGLRGSMARKLPNRWWNNDLAFPKKELFLDLLASHGDEEQGNRYNFRFLEPSRTTGAEEHLWYRVGDIINVKDGPDLNDWLIDQGLAGERLRRGYRILDRLWQVVTKQPFIVYYKEESQDIERVLNIFIRLNSGGTQLSYSDLLLSIAVAQWTKLDARAQIHECVDELNRCGTGFNFSKDFVLKAGLMLADIASVGFKVENFNHENMQKLESVWPDVREALKAAVDLVASFGINGYTLRAHSSVLPIAYYLYKIGAPENFDRSQRFVVDRERIRGWFIRSLLKASGIWGSGLDTLLTHLRTTIDECHQERFPSEELRRVMSQRGKTLQFETEEIEELADLTYGDKRTFLLLSQLFAFVDLRNRFHVDHVFPRMRFTPAQLRREGIEGEDAERLRAKSERLANLQLLDGVQNNEKRTTLPREWLAKAHQDETSRRHYCSKHDLDELPRSIHEFEAFYDARRTCLRDRIAAIINAATEQSEQAA